jgi:hypothetical protein
VACRHPHRYSHTDEELDYRQKAAKRVGLDLIVGPRSAALCGPGQLPHMFQGLRTTHYEEPIALPDFGQAQVRIVRFAAQTP